VGSDVLAELTWLYRKAQCGHFSKQLIVYEMDLAKVRLGRVSANARPMLNGDAGVSIALDAEAGNQFDRSHEGFREPVVE